MALEAPGEVDELGGLDEDDENEVVALKLLNK
jgi:hypothetical protein